jgi:hypothetical protein
MRVSLHLVPWVKIGPNSNRINDLANNALLYTTKNAYHDRLKMPFTCRLKSLKNLTVFSTIGTDSVDR